MSGNPEMIGYLQRLAGVCLTGYSDLQELYISYGPGANGKSVFFDTLTALLGAYASVAPESLLTARQAGGEHPTGLARLSGKRMVIVSETESGAKLRVQRMKRLTGDSTLTARFMRQNFFEFRRTFKLVIITNNRPRITEHSDAVWRRLRLIPFDVIIPKPIGILTCCTACGTSSPASWHGRFGAGRRSKPAACSARQGVVANGTVPKRDGRNPGVRP